MNTVIVLGADRVGKSTLIKNTETLLDKSNHLSYKTLHFSEVKPYHNSPIEQFMDRLSQIKVMGKPDILLCDRFSSDTIFYEEHRHQTGAHDVELSRVVESVYMGESEHVSVIFLRPSWSSELEARHREELMPGSAWWVSRILEKRKQEHKNYNSFTNAYLDNQTLIDRSNIIRVGGDRDYTTVFDLLPNLLGDDHDD